jgi:hypothetical protein
MQQILLYFMPYDEDMPIHTFFQGKSCILCASQHRHYAHEENSLESH